jgi:endo-1,4-beta-xylanase
MSREDPTASVYVRTRSSCTNVHKAAQAAGRFVGAAIPDHRLGDPAYEAIASAEFSSVTSEYSMKWPQHQQARDTFDFAAGDRLVDFAHRNAQQVHGHCLL